MYIDSILLASRDDELDFMLAGGLSGIGGGSTPFGIFPELGIQRIDLNAVTVLAGSSVTPKLLLLRIIAAKLGSRILLNGMTAESLDEYLNLCVTKYSDFSCRNFGAVHITLEQSAEHLAQGKSAAELFDKRMRPNSLILLEEPERGLTLEEQTELAYHIACMSQSGSSQFVITSNSPVFLGIKGALIYDFDERPILPRRWHNSRLARSHVQFLEQLRENHTHSKNIKTAD